MSSEKLITLMIPVSVLFRRKGRKKVHSIEFRAANRKDCFALSHFLLPKGTEFMGWTIGPKTVLCTRYW